jgi:hypothetical protein
MKTILHNEVLSGALQRIKKWSLTGFFDGSQNTTSYLENCRWWIQQYQCIIIFTRDTGHHTCGWWKNPDYEQCFHLSISFPGGRNKSAIDKILSGFFGEHKSKLWIEPPYSEIGKSKEVWHYRLFCDKFWNPIIPRGEVYSKQFTDIGWKSYSEIHPS